MIESVQVRTRRWSRAEYDRLIALGIIQEDERLELLAGELVLRDRQSPGHAFAIQALSEALQRAIGSGSHVRVFSPIALDSESEPEPDLSVVPGAIRDYRDDHPSQPTLLVEVADTSLVFDRGHKSSLYARARMPEYWIVNLVDGVLEVYREPAPDVGAPYGWAYRVALRLGPDERATPLAVTSARILVADFLP
jgi:Uma2 family endonuclease